VNDQEGVRTLINKDGLARTPHGSSNGRILISFSGIETIASSSNAGVD